MQQTHLRLYGRVVADPVQAQLEAYNARDIVAFVACYATDVIVIDGRGAVLIAGIDSVRSTYGAMFTANPDVHAEVVDRQRVGSWTVDHERVTGTGQIVEVLAAYDVGLDLIQHVVMLR